MWYNGCVPYPLPLLRVFVLVNMLFIFFIVSISIHKDKKKLNTKKIFLILKKTIIFAFDKKTHL